MRPIPHSFPAQRALAVLAAAITLAGCAPSGPGKNALPPAATAVPPGEEAIAVAPPSTAPRTLQIANEGRIGTVRMLGRGGRFVLVETLNGGMLPLPDGQDLHCRANAEPGAPPTANLRLGRERRQQFATADVVDGQPQVGDAVFVGGPPLAPIIPLGALGERP